MDLPDDSVDGHLAMAWRLSHPVPAVRRLGADELVQLDIVALASCAHVVARQLPELLPHLHEDVVQVAVCRAVATLPATAFDAVCAAAVIEFRDALEVVVGGAFGCERRAAAWAALARLPPAVLWPRAVHLLQTAASEDADMATSAIALNEGVLAQVSGAVDYRTEARFAELNANVRELGLVTRSATPAARRGAIVVLAIRTYLFGDAAADAEAKRCASVPEARRLAAVAYANAGKYFYSVQAWARKFVLDAARSNSEWVCDPIKAVVLRRAPHRAHAMMCVAAIGASLSGLMDVLHAGLRDEDDEVVLQSVRALKRVDSDADVGRLLARSRVHASMRRCGLRTDVSNDVLDALDRVSTPALAEHAELLQDMVRGTVRVTMVAEAQALAGLARLNLQHSEV